VVAVRAEEVFDHAPGVLDIDDIERVHDMRVATRRLRAALEVFEPCFPRKRWRRVRKRVGKLADALGERRDRDVAIGFLEGCAGDLSGADLEALGALIGELRAEQLQANEELATFVRAKRLEKLRRRLDELVAEAGS
jgi:CHAD domain-containing protein